MIRKGDKNGTSLVFYTDVGRTGTHYGELRHYNISPGDNAMFITFYWGTVSITGANLHLIADIIDSHLAASFSIDSEENQDTETSPISNIEVDFNEE